MSISRFHAEWLSLLEISGPFLSLPVLVRRFPQGLESHDPEHFRLLRQVHDEWDDNQQGLKPDPRIHTTWIKWILKNTLELEDVLLEGQGIPQTIKAEIEEPQSRETLRPDMVLMNPDGKKPRLLVQTYPLRQKLTQVVHGKAWKASPDTRMTQLLRDTGVTLGLITNGDQWMLVYAPKGETSGYTSWYSTIWLEEPKTLAAFRTLLGLHRFFGVSEEETLEAMLAESAADQQEVTDQLGYQVRKAVEVLVHSLDKADQDYDGKLLEGVSEKVLYEASLTVMMRLVFLFCAEERELLLLGDEIYDLNYAVSTLREQLRTTAYNHGEEILERRHDAWNRLLTTFRAVYAGVQHERMKLPPYGGSLFNPDRFPFLEGREPKTSWRDTPSQPLPINNRTVLHLLEALQVLQVRLPGGGPAEPRKLSFRALDIEQIGHVYEGLLDHTAVRATEPVLGLAGTRDSEPEVPLSKLEELSAKGEKDLLEFLKKETGRSSVATIKRVRTAEIDDQTGNRFRTACHGSEELWKRIQPFAGLVRNDTFGYPAVIVNKSVYVTAGTDRRSSGTHYTPKSLTEPIVQYTLEPLVYHGPAEGKPRAEWKLKTAAEILDLKICDMACGSGAFLVQVCRYLADRLIEAWEAVEKSGDGTPKVTPFGKISEGEPKEQIIPSDPEERLAYARRIIAQRCLYGVDVNPLAVEMAKLSLWLLTLAKDKPFEFLDHNIRCGDSLVGIHDNEQLKHFSLKPDNADTPLFKGPLDQAVKEAIDLRLKLEGMPSNTVEDIEAQEKLLEKANDKIARLRCAADLLVAAEFWGDNAKDKHERLQKASTLAAQYVENGPTEEFEQIAAKERRGQKMFHWPLEFPEVIVKRGGFDGFVGNPPFLGGKRISTEYGDTYERNLKYTFSRSKGAADFCCYFFRRSFTLLRSSNTFLGLLATNSIVEGDSRPVGLGAIIEDGGAVFRARRQFEWPGQAGVSASQIHISKVDTQMPKCLDNEIVAGITSYLDAADNFHPNPLKSSTIDYSQGPTLNGSGFILGMDEMNQLASEEPCSSEVIFPYLNAEILNNTSTCDPCSWAINFGTMDIEEARRYNAAFRIVTDRVKPERDRLTRQVHESRYWLYWDKRERFLEAIASKTRVLVCPIVTKYLSFRFYPSTWVFSHGLKVFDIQSASIFAVFQSALHECWARKYSSSLEQRLRYSTSDAFDTFPLPKAIVSEVLGGELYSVRESLLATYGCGLTKLYNRFHDSDETSVDIQKLRDLHVEMDKAVAAAYVWSDLDLGHGFHETKQGVRFTISEPARRELLQRLLKLNHDRYAEEVKQGLHGKKGAVKKTATPKKRATKKKTLATPSLFGEDDTEDG